MGNSGSRLCRGAIIFHGGKKVNKNGRGGKVAPNGYKILSIVLAALLAAVAVVELVLWRLDYIVFQNPNAQEQPAEQDSLLIGESEGNGVEIKSAKIASENYAEYGISEQAESAYTLTATVEPANAVNKAVDWTIVFVDPSSEWATGKTVTDYVTLTPQADGSTVATVQCLQDFGEQMKITVTSRDNPEAKAECTVDYMQKIKKFKYVFADISTFVNPINYLTEEETELSGPIDFRNTMRINDMGNFEFSEFTISRSVEVSGTMQLTDDFIAALKEVFPSCKPLGKKVITASWSDKTSSQEFSLSDLWSSLFSGIENTPENAKKIADICSSISEHFYIEISMSEELSAFETFTYRGGQFATVNFLADVENVELDQDNIVF